jgi:two-component system sensor histidine kinase UhpB
VNARLQVLIVEDSPDDCRLLERELERGGLQAAVERVDTPEVLRAALDKQRWDVVIVDYSMPRFSGLAALKLLQEMWIDLPVIVVSGTIGEDLAVEAMQAGAHDYILKTNLIRLIPAIERELREAEARRAGAKAESDLREAEARYRALVEQSLVGVYLLRTDRFLYINEAGARIFGYRVEEIVHRLGPGDLVAPESRALVAEKIRQRLSGEQEAFQYTFGGLRKDGSTIDCEVFGRRILFEGQPTILGTLLDVTERRRAEEKLTRSKEGLRALAARLQFVREEERAHIAREIHDELGQALTGIKFEIARLPKVAADEAKLKPALESMNRLVDGTIQTVRRIATALRPGVLDDLGLVAAIEWQTREFQKRTGIPCEASLPPSDIKLDRDRSTAVFRIFQETLTNVIRHAKATRVNVRLQYHPSSLELEVRDNGEGITDIIVLHPRSLGLLGMRERVIPFGGEFHISGSPGKGTRVVVRLPVMQSKTGANG